MQGVPIVTDVIVDHVLVSEIVTVRVKEIRNDLVYEARGVMGTTDPAFIMTTVHEKHEREVYRGSDLDEAYRIANFYRDQIHGSP